MNNQTESIRFYLEQQIKDGYDSLLEIQRASEDKLYPKRYLAAQLNQAAESFLADHLQSQDRWFIITGLRGVGKTTVLAQAYTHLKQTHPNKKFNQLYIDLADITNKVDVNLAQLLDGYQELLGSSWVKNNIPTFIFIDEVQVDPRWARSLKALHDKARNIFFVCTGSSAADLQIDADVAGRRARLEKLHPLNFAEYQFLTNGLAPDLKLKEQLLAASYDSSSATEAFKQLKSLQTRVNHQWLKYDRHSLNNYLTFGSLPFSLRYAETSLIYADLNKLIERVVGYDLRRLHPFSSESLLMINQLLFLLATAGDVVSFKKLTENLKTNSRQLWLILDVLQKAGLITKVSAWGGHFKTTRHPARYHFASPALRAALYNTVGDPGSELIRKGKLLEDIAVMHYYREFVTNRRAELNHPYDKKQKHCDFILKLQGSHQLAIEFGAGGKGIGQVAQTMTKIKCRYGIVFTKSNLQLDNSQSIVLIPLDYFFLM